jgi:hypothetical protein
MSVINNVPSEVLTEALHCLEAAGYPVAAGKIRNLLATAQPAADGEREAFEQAERDCVRQGHPAMAFMHRNDLLANFKARADQPAKAEGVAVPKEWRAGVIDVAKLIQKIADDYATEFGHDDMGGLSFGSGQSAEIRSDYHTMLLDLVDEVNGMLAAAPALPVTSGAFKLCDHVRKTKGSQWSGRVVGTYNTELTPEGYAVESSTEKGSVQIYPASALELDHGSPNHTEQVRLAKKALELCDAAENKEDLPLNKWALKTGRLVNEVRDLAEQYAAAPSAGSQQEQGE